MKTPWDFHGDSTLFNFFETQASGFGPPEPPETNPPLDSIPSPRFNFTFGDNMEANPWWLTINALANLGPQNPLPKHPEKLLPKFDPDDDILPETHINKFMFSMNIMNVQHEYEACKLFGFTLQGKASSWFFNIPSGSITSWQQFENEFITQFGDDKTLGTLFLEL